MHAVDILILSVIAISIAIGVSRGLVKELIALITLIVAVTLAFHQTQWLLPYFGGAMLAHPARVWVARLVLFVLILVVGQFVGWLASFIVNRIPIINIMNWLLGGVFGLLRGLVIVGLATLLGLEWHLQEAPWWQQSQWMGSAERVAGVVRMLSGPWTIDLDGNSKRSS